MDVLLDTHAFLWWLDGDPTLPARTRRLIGDQRTRVLVSAVTGWEITTKHRVGKMPDAAAVAADVAGAIASQGFLTLPITLPHAQLAGALPGPHRDPWDRMLAAQSLIEDLPIVSSDKALESFGAARLWI